MHETRFVNEIFAVLKEKLDKNARPGKIAVNVRLSPFSHVSPETLHESFKVLAQGNEFKGVSLNILPLELKMECKSCKRKETITKKIFECPFCGSADIYIPMDKEFFVESLEVEK